MPTREPPDTERVPLQSSPASAALITGYPFALTYTVPPVMYILPLAILIREGFEMDDDMASFFEEEEKETATQETRKKKLADLDVDILVNALTKPVSDEKKTDEDGNDDTETQTTESEQPPASASIPFPESENLK